MGLHGYGWLVLNTSHYRPTRQMVLQCHSPSLTRLRKASTVLSPQYPAARSAAIRHRQAPWGIRAGRRVGLGARTWLGEPSAGGPIGSRSEIL
jgi:hypothetical protein